MAAIPISVIVVSRHRPELLRRCLTAIGQLDHDRFETVVVACPRGAQVARSMGVAKVCDFDTANISVARNLGVSRASGDVLAFVDDDAVPEPTWLAHLADVFDDPAVVQAGGITLGRNGISVQHGATRVDAMGKSHAAAVSGTDPVVLASEGDRYPRLHGTNMAIRRQALADHGGFDPRFAFYLDETDLSLRIARAGGATMFVPKAIVHHASGASAFRDADRTPRQVAEIAASAAVFHRKHCAAALWCEARQGFLEDRKAWLVGHMHRGTLAPDVAARLIRELAEGYAEGLTRTEVEGLRLSDAEDAIPECRAAGRKDLYLVRRRATGNRVFETAKALVQAGNRVTVFDLRPDARYHRVAFTDDGFWLHRGGIFGREVREEPLFQKATREERIRTTLARIAGIRSKNPLFRA